MPPSPVVLITGCSSGIGRSLVLEGLSSGVRVIATARRLDSIQDLHEKGAQILSLDVTAPPADLKEFIKTAIDIHGQIDILINNAGYFLGGAIEENTNEEVRGQFDTNFFGVINLTNALLPHFRQRRMGTIVNMSSQGAFLSISGAGIYCASKAALDSISEVWAKELAPFNIRCMTVNLGAFRTAVASGSNFKAPANGEIEGYNAAHDFLRMFAERSGQEQGDSNKAARRLVDLVSTDKPLPVRLPLGEDSVVNAGRAWSRLEKEWQEVQELGTGTNIDGLELDDNRPAQG
ncbi:hypothetical protein AAF712_007110 [Marasmius tenuissimus]|uniref:Uncharacterized protein n=1 Tax=Marasmius tenuissimus TaxID=585030 RepID=A0ABR2ZVU4_9AGAR